MELKAGKSQKSVFLAWGALESLQWQFDHLQFDLIANQTAPYFDQVPP